MVDRKQRDLLADAIHDLIIGRISNDGFDNRISQYGMHPLRNQGQCHDAAILPLLDRSWCLYSDHYEYYLTGAKSLTREQRVEVLRWILFLRSDFDYQWPARRFVNPAFVSFSGCLLSLLTLGFWQGVETEESLIEWAQSGDIAVWPFLKRAEFEKAYSEFCPLRRHLQK